MEVKLEMKDLILKNQSGFKNSREAITIFLIIFNNI